MIHITDDLEHQSHQSVNQSIIQSINLGSRQWNQIPAPHASALNSHLGPVTLFCSWGGSKSRESRETDQLLAKCQPVSGLFQKQACPSPHPSPPPTPVHIYLPIYLSTPCCPTPLDLEPDPSALDRSAVGLVATGHNNPHILGKDIIIVSLPQPPGHTTTPTAIRFLPTWAVSHQQNEDQDQDQDQRNCCVDLGCTNCKSTSTSSYGYGRHSYRYRYRDQYHTSSRPWAGPAKTATLDRQSSSQRCLLSARQLDRYPSHSRLCQHCLVSRPPHPPQRKLYPAQFKNPDLARP